MIRPKIKKVDYPKYNRIKWLLRENLIEETCSHKQRSELSTVTMQNLRQLHHTLNANILRMCDSTRKSQARSC